MKHDNYLFVVMLLAAPGLASASPCGFVNPGGGVADFGGAPASYGTASASNGSSEFECLGSSDPHYQAAATPVVGYGGPVPAEGSGNAVTFLGSFANPADTVPYTDVYTRGLLGQG